MMRFPNCVIYSIHQTPDGPIARQWANRQIIATLKFAKGLSEDDIRAELRAKHRGTQIAWKSA